MPTTIDPPAERDAPVQDSKAFRRSLGQYPTGVTIIAARHRDTLVGMAVNSFAAVSLTPPLVLWSIRRESRNARAFLDAGHFAVSILAAHQVDVAQCFGASLPDRFDRFPWHADPHGAPLIDGAIAHLECRTVAAHDGGDHHILVGQVLRHARHDGEPLVFAQGQYAVTQNHPHLAAAARTPLDTPGSVPALAPNFLRLLSMASQRMSSGFQVHRDALALTPAMSRILAVLHESPRSLDELEHTTYLGRLSLEDGLASLYERGLVQRQPDGQYTSTTEGRHNRECLAQRSDGFAKEKLQGLAPADIEAARRVLTMLQAR